MRRPGKKEINTHTQRYTAAAAVVRATAKESHQLNHYHENDYLDESQAMLGPGHNSVLGPAGVGGILATGSSATTKIVHVTGQFLLKSGIFRGFLPLWLIFGFYGHFWAPFGHMKVKPCWAMDIILFWAQRALAGSSSTTKIVHVTGQFAKICQNI